MYLMCKDKIVYDIENDIVCCRELLPGCMLNNANRDSFDYWWRHRYSSSSNRQAQRIKDIKYGKVMAEIDKITHGLSLVDCYWVTDNIVKFDDITPYHTIRTCAEPSLYVNGIQDKEWNDMGLLVKCTNNTEIENAALDLCRVLGVSEIRCYVENGVLYLENFTSENLMLEQANQSGKLNMYDFNNEDILRYLGVEYGLQMLFIDAVVGNGDRHAGNFGWLRDANTGKYVRPAPLYDFDHALDDRGMFLISDFITTLNKHSEYVDKFITLCNNPDIPEIFKGRTLKIRRFLNEIK